MKHILYVYAIIALSLYEAYNQPVIKAIRVETTPVIDGQVKEDIWDKAFMVDEFYQREPNEGAPASEKTEFLVCHNSDYIYFGIRCWGDPRKITAKEMARNANLKNDDCINIILDTYNDRRNAYWFQIGPRGSIADALISENGAGFNRDWMGIWTGKATIQDYGWEAELAIPFKTIGFDKSITQWGIKFARKIKHKMEVSYWPEANLNTHILQVSDAGILTGIEGITQGIGLDISPYIVTGMDTKKGEKNFSKLTGGMDMYYQVTPSLRSSITINTDFAETEVDYRQINLTRFNLHFPEKRNFFLDGANYYQFGIESDYYSPVAQKIIPFFSRRMGLDENGDPISINYGAKLIGRIKNWNIGMLHINDNRENGNNNFSVARISRNFGQQSSVGIIGTYGNALNDVTNLLAGADLKLSTSHFQSNKNASILFFGLKSNTENTYGEESAWGTQLVYPNDFINARLGHHQIGENFIAGIGFVPRTNIKETYGELEFGPRPNKFGIIQIQFGGSFDYIRNKQDEYTETKEFKIKPVGLRFLSGEEISYTLINQYENLTTDFNIFGDFIIPKSGYAWWRNELNLLTTGARSVWGEAKYSFGDFYNGNRRNIELKMNWKVAIPFFLGVNFIQNYIEIPQGNFNANIYQLNANILFNPNITLYNFIQYDNESKNAEWQSRFQWILKPGNEIILAWNSNFLKLANDFFMKESAIRLKLKYNIRF